MQIIFLNIHIKIYNGSSMQNNYPYQNRASMPNNEQKTSKPFDNFRCIQRYFNFLNSYFKYFN